MPDRPAAEVMRMRKLRALAGMPVVCGKRRIGRVVRAELDDDLLALRGLWINAGLRGTRFLPAEHIQLVGQAAVLADDWGVRGRMGAAPLFRRAVSTDGRRLGAITGAEFDPLTLGVTSLELSGGLWDDFMRPRQRVLRFTVDPRTREVIIDPQANGKEEDAHEGRHDEGTDHRHGAGRRGGDDLRRDELADRAPVEPEGPPDGQLDRRQGR